MSQFAKNISSAIELNPTIDQIMAAEELVPDILAIVAARLKEQVQILAWIQCSPDLSPDWSLDVSLDLNLKISTESAEADRLGGTGEINKIKQLRPYLERKNLCPQKITH